MENFNLLNRIKELYGNGENIIQTLREKGKRNQNTVEDILISYDFQAGSYTKQYLNEKAQKEVYDQSGIDLADVINNLESVDSILDVGVGEATNLKIVLQNLSKKPKNVLGFDISWSRLKFAKNFLKESGIAVKLLTANLFKIPLLDNSVDLIFTTGALEPNGGKEVEALMELYRVSKKYLVLIEPDFDNATDEIKKRMKQHGYVSGLHEKAQKLGYNVVEYRPWYSGATCYSIIIIKKEVTFSNAPEVVCPVTHAELSRYSDSLLYSKESMLAYPVIDDIPCLLENNAILAVHLNTDYHEFIGN